MPSTGAGGICVWYTHHMTTPPDALERLDEALVHTRRLLQRPGYRRRLLAALPDRVELTVLRVLRAVEGHGDTAPSIGQVAEVLVVEPSTASRFVERAAAMGYLERHACQHDRRRTRLQLTAAGTRLLAQATAARRELLAEVTDGWAGGDVEALAELLQHLRAGFDRLDDA